MFKPLAEEDIDTKLQADIYVQNYDHRDSIEGVKIITLKNIVGEEGDFNEVVRINDENEIESLPGFKIRQISRTRLFPGSVKAWHLHFNQDEIWYISPSDHLLVGLWDIRKNSKTCGLTMKYVLGGGASQLLFIPRGVAHGSAVITRKPIELYYLVNKQFNIKDPDEKRIRWDYLGRDF